MVPVRISVLAPESFRAPVPLIVFEKVWLDVLLYCSVPLSAIVPAYVPDPRLPLPLICSVPALIVVLPE